LRQASFLAIRIRLDSSSSGTTIARPDTTISGGGRVREFVILLVKEEKALFSWPVAYAVIAVFQLIMWYSFTLTLFISHSTTRIHLFFQMFALFLLTVPIITMRL